MGIAAFVSLCKTLWGLRIILLLFPTHHYGTKWNLTTHWVSVVWCLPSIWEWLFGLSLQCLWLPRDLSWQLLLETRSPLTQGCLRWGEELKWTRGGYRPRVSCSHTHQQSINNPQHLVVESSANTSEWKTPNRRRFLLAPTLLCVMMVSSRQSWRKIFIGHLDMFS